MMTRVAVVGSGFMARTHLQAYDGLLDVEPVAVCSRDPDRGRSVADEYQARWTDEFETVLTSDEVDAVDLCVPTPLHVEMAEASLEAGKSVLLEKPIALTLEGADRLVELEESSDGVLMVALVLRFWPEYIQFLDMVAGGELGEVETMLAYRLSPPADWNDWMIDESRSGGVPVDLMSHDFDQAIAVMGMPTEVMAGARGDRQHVFAQLAHTRGVSVVEGSMGMPTSYPFSCGFRVMGERRTVTYDFQVGATTEGGNLGEAASVDGLLVAPADGDLQRQEVDQQDPFHAEISYFVECVSAGRRPERGTASQARDALAVALAVNRSLDSGQPEEVAS